MKKSTFVLLAGILLAGLFLRVFKLTELFYFTHDEETIVWRVMPLLRDRNLFLLGGVTPFHVHLGPWFYYLSALGLFLSQSDPLGWGIMAAVVSLCTMFMLFILTRKLYGAYAGLLATSYYATSFLMIAFDRHWWPLSLGPLLSLAAIYSLIKITKNKFHYAIPLGLILALSFHTDPSNWALILLVVVSGFTHVIPVKAPPAGGNLVRNLYRFRVKHGMTKLLVTIIFLSSFLPLVAFDLKNSGKNISEAKKYLTETKVKQGWSLNKFTWTALYVPRTLGRLLYSPQTELTQLYSYCPQYSQGRVNSAPWITTILAVVIITIFFLPKSSSEVAVRTPRTVDGVIRWYFALVFIGINIYGNFFSSDLFDHYLVTLFPLFFIMIASLLSRLPRTLSTIILASMIVTNLWSFSQITNKYGYKDKIAAVNWVVNEQKSQPFSLDVLGSCHRYSGIRHLFTLAGHEPDLSFVDPNFFWLYKTPPKTEYPKSHAVFVMLDEQEPPETKQQYIELLSRITARRQFGSIDALIVDNSDRRFTIDF